MKDVVIVGGGIAGISLALLLKRDRYRIQICERSTPGFEDGHAFLVHPSAVEILKELAPQEITHEIPGSIIQDVIIRNQQNQIITSDHLGQWLCVRRSQLVRYLRAILNDDAIAYDHRFRRFESNNGQRTTSVVFENGEIVRGDIFIGSDGARSIIREELFGPTNYSPVRVKEVVGTVKSTNIAQTFQGQFNKYMHEEKGIAFGFIPCSSDEVVWFMQFDAELQLNDLSSPKKIHAHCSHYAADFPDAIKEIVQSNDYTTNYLWRSTDFEMLERFHQGNVGLIGDAAHVALPFTSAGVANALMDAKTLASCMNHYDDEERAFEKFYSLRHRALEEHVKLGRVIQENFLSGTYVGAVIPLIKQLESSSSSK